MSKRKQIHESEFAAAVVQLDAAAKVLRKYGDHAGAANVMNVAKLIAEFLNLDRAAFALRANVDPPPYRSVRDLVRMHDD
jgi:hypothetical protein